jgi:cell division protease FtsH
MTPTNNDTTGPPTAPPDGRRVERQPITDVNAWLDDLDIDVRPTLRALGELLVGVSERDRGETDDRFTARCLGAGDHRMLLAEERPLNLYHRRRVRILPGTQTLDA